MTMTAELIDAFDHVKYNPYVPEWDKLDAFDKALFEACFESRPTVPGSSPAPKVGRVHYLALPVNMMFGDWSYVIYQVDTSHNVTNSWMILNGIAKTCPCPDNMRKGRACYHQELLSAIAGRLEASRFGAVPNNLLQFPAFVIEVHTNVLSASTCTILPFHLQEPQISITAQATSALKNEVTIGWAEYFAGKYTSLKGIPKDQRDFMAIGVCSPSLNLVLKGSRGVIRGSADPKKLDECIASWKAVAGQDIAYKPPKEAVIEAPRKKTQLAALNHKKPNDGEFYIADPVWRQCLFCVANSKNMMLLGPAGTGKTELAGEVAKAVGKQLQSFDLGAMTEARLSLIGNTHYSPEKGTFFGESRFVKAITTEGSLILLDEISRAPRDAANLLFPVLDKRRQLAIDETGQVIKVAKDVCFIATANVGAEYSGTSAMDRALRDRFSQIELAFPPAKQEIEILQQRTGIPAKFAGYLVSIATKQRMRAVADQEFLEQISTRMLLNAAEQFAFGISFKESVEYSILGMFSSDGQAESDRAKITQIVSGEVLRKDLDATL